MDSTPPNNEQNFADMYARSAGAPRRRPSQHALTARRLRAAHARRRTRDAQRGSLFARASIFTAALLVVVTASVLTASFAAAAAYYQAESGIVRGLSHTVASQNSLRIYDRNGHLLAEMDQNGIQHDIPLAKIPVNVVNATVAIEDHTFWVNPGVDPSSIVRAALADVTSGHITQGGSSITQQLIKSEILGEQTTYTRKLKEVVLSIGITMRNVYSKQQILNLYLNSIPYSPTAYGIDAAAHTYFGYSDNPTTGESAAQQLDLAQASMLAGIPQNPSLNDPLLHFAHAHARQAEVLHAMVNYGYITPAQASAAYAEAGGAHFFHPGPAPTNLAPQFVNFVLQQVRQMIASGQVHDLARSGLQIYTTLDLNLQNHTLSAMRQHLFGNDTTDFAVPTYIRNDNVTNSAALIADQHTGGIRVYQGSVNYNNTADNGQFDVISQGYRSPGSSFKPIVYATAFEKGWFPGMVVSDVPTAFWDPGSSSAYKPLDYDNTSAAGPVTLRTALDWSLNIPAVKVMQFAGVTDVQRVAHSLGVTQAHGTWGLASVLGAMDVTPYEMVQAYTVFANYGQYIPLHSIDRITDGSGSVLYQYSAPKPVQVLDPRIAFLITSMLSDNASRAGDFGGCSPLYLDPYMGGSDTHYTVNGAYGSAQCQYLASHRYLSPAAWPSAAKTGTAQNFKDDWTIGYTMDYTGAVWVGNNNDTPMHNIDGVSGAAPIWYSSMLYAEQATGKAKRAFPVPRGVHRATYCSSGVCTNDWMLDGAAPPVNAGDNASLPCVTLDQTGGWHLSSVCQVHLAHHELQNAGAPPSPPGFVGAP
jgi:membrane peptidoglycan carboxypeptidase